MSGLTLYLPGKRLLKNAQKRSFLSVGRGLQLRITHAQKSLSLRSPYTLKKKSEYNPLVRILSAQTPIISLFGSLSFLLLGALILIMQPQPNTVQAETISSQTLYQEYSDISTFPKTKAVEVQMLEKQKLNVYTVQAGDSIHQICLELKADCESVKSLNSLEYPYRLRVGQSIYFKQI